MLLIKQENRMKEKLVQISTEDQVRGTHTAQAT